MTSNQDLPSFQVIDDLHAPTYFDADKFRSGLGYKARADDIFIITYPKSGTTWMEVIVFCLLNNGKSFDTDIDNYLKRTPRLEREGADNIYAISPPYSIKTHLPFNRIPYHSQAKYICVIRNPKDVCISLYEFLSKHPQSKYFQCQFDKFFTDFIKDQLPYGDCFQYLRSLYMYKDRENVLIVSYEQMKRDIRRVIRQVAQFLNINLLNQDELLDQVATFSSFEYMKKNFDAARNKHTTKIMNDGIPKGLPLTYVRNGNVGEWKTYMTVEQNEQFEKYSAEKLRDMPEFEALWQ